MTATNEQAVARHFDHYASRHIWQDLYEKELSRHNVAYALRLNAYARLMRDLKPASVLDIGCGSGDFLVALPSEQTRYHGVDISSDMIESVKEKIDKLPPERREWTTCEVAGLSDFDSREKFDFILASGFVEYFEDLGPVVEKMASVTKSGGYVATQVSNRLYYKFKGVRHWQSEGKPFRHHRITREECDGVHEEAGLIKEKGFYLDHVYFPKSRKWFPRIHYSLCERFSDATPESYSRRYASMYLGLYRKP